MPKKKCELNENLDVYDLEPPEFFSKPRIDKGDGSILFDLIPISKPDRCPFCNSTDIIQHGPYTRKVRDLPLHNHHVGLRIHDNRYICKECGRSWIPEYCSINSQSRVTNRLREHIELLSLEKPFLSIAAEYSLSDTTVKRIFNSFVQSLESQRDIYAPKVLGIDENHLNNHFRAVFVDVENKKLLEIKETRTKETVIDYILSLPNYDSIQVVTMDMWKPYKEAVYEVLPNVAIVVDHFHVVKEVNQCLEKIRKALNHNLNKRQRAEIRNQRALLLKNNDNLNKEQKKQLEVFLDKNPDFKRAYRAKELLFDIYKQETKDDALQYFDSIQEMIYEYIDELSEFKEVLKTIQRWKPEIFNYFDYKYTNAATENINKEINRIGNDGRGYSFEVLRAKALFKTKIKKKPKFSFEDDV